MCLDKVASFWLVLRIGTLVPLVSLLFVWCHNQHLLAWRWWHGG